MSTKPPRVSVGIPLYNEEKYLAQALDSLLAQDFEDFELVISDNASQDATQQICLEYAARDPRIHYHRNEVNQGPIDNFNRVFRLTSGEYFMWASGHDLRAPQFISRCLEVLEQDPAVVLCYSWVRSIDAGGQELGMMHYATHIDTRNCGLLWRFNLAVLPLTHGSEFYGLFRSSALQKTHLVRKVLGPDALLLVELSILGCFASIPEYLFYARDQRGELTRPYKEWKKRHIDVLFPGKKRWYYRFLFITDTWEQLRTVKRAPLDYARKTAMIASVIFVLFFVRFYRSLPFKLRLPIWNIRAFLLRRLGVVVLR